MPYRNPFAVSVLLGGLLGSAAAPSLAQQSPEHSPPTADAFPLASDPLLESLLQEALARNPGLRAVEERHAAARERGEQAAALPDPRLTLGYDYDGAGFTPGATPDTGPKLAVAQELPGPGKRALLREVEEHGVELQGHAAMRQRLVLVYQLRKAYADLLLARENLAILEDQRRATKDVEELTRSRYAVGLAEQSDVLRAQAELARLDQMRFHEEGLVAIALAELNRLLDRPAGTPLDGTPRLSSLAARRITLPELAAVVARAEAMSPVVLGGGSLVAGADARLRLARRGSKPDYMLASAWLYRGSLPDMWTVDVGITLPIYKGSKQKRAVAEAEALLRAERSAQRAMTLGARAAVEKAWADLRASLLEAEAFAKGVLVVDQLAVESAIASFQSGKTPFVTVLEAHNTLYRDRWAHAELLFHVLWHSAALDAYGITGE